MQTDQSNESEIGLGYYVARSYNLTPVHFIQLGTLVLDAESCQLYDRNAHVSNNPIKHESIKRAFRYI
jgi:hypothetical protein